MSTKCVECQSRPVFVQKRGLCKVCYQRFRASQHVKNICVKCGERRIVLEYLNEQLCQFCGREETNVLTPTYRELEFVRNFFTHKNWYYQPITFNLGYTKYTPDFYDIEREMFIEVAGTRQAYSQSRDKYLKLRKLFPTWKLEVRTPEGELYNGKDQLIPSAAE